MICFTVASTRLKRLKTAYDSALAQRLFLCCVQSRENKAREFYRIDNRPPVRITITCDVIVLIIEPFDLYYITDYFTVTDNGLRIVLKEQLSTGNMGVIKQ